MIKMSNVFLIVALIVFLSAIAAASPRKERSLSTLLHAIGEVESGNNDTCKDGDDDKSIGRYQIQHQYWYDAVHTPAAEPAHDIKIHTGEYQDCRHARYAEQTIIWYWRRYCPQALAKLDYEVLARTHNGGPKGSQRTSTLKYWNKVKKALK